MSEYEVAINLLRTVYRLTGHADAIESAVKTFRSQLSTQAAQIAALRAENARLREALEAIANSDCCGSFVDGCARHQIVGDRNNVCAISKAKAALSPAAPEEK